VEEKLSLCLVEWFEDMILMNLVVTQVRELCKLHENLDDL
jgi:hypothetical protein